MASPEQPGPSSRPVEASSTAALLDALFAESSDAVVVVDQSAGITYASRGAELLLGYDAESVLGTAVLGFVHPDDVSTAERLLVQRFGYGGADMGHRLRVRHSSGAWLDVTVTATVLPPTGVGALAIRLFATDAANDEIERSLRRRIAVGEFTNRVSVELLESTDAATVISRIERSLEQIGLLTGADLVVVVLEGLPRRRFELQAAWLERRYAEDRSIELDLDEDALERLMTDHVTANSLEDQRLRWLRRATRSLGAVSVLSTPFTTAAQRGALVLMRLAAGPDWSDSDAELVEGVAVLFGRALRSAQMEQLLGLTYWQGPIGFSLRNWEGSLVSCNQQYLDLYGLEQDEAARIDLMELIQPPHRRRVRESLDRLRAGEIDRFGHEVEVVRGDGTGLWVRSRVVGLEVPGWPDRLVVTSVEDITAERRQRNELEFAASHDQLTGLPNRTSMRDTIDRVTGVEGELPALLILDLDRFKLVNDSMGHTVGDRVLRAAADRLTEAVGRQGIVARLGGDEFAVAVWHVGTAEVRRFAQFLQRSFERPLDVERRSILQTISIGAVVGTEAADSADLFVSADRALRRAKADGRNQHVLFDESLRGEALRSLELERDLRSAMRSGELEVHLQPEFDVGDRSIVGAEALLRWRHPTRGLMPANDFIEIAEHSGMIDDIGRFALRSAAGAFASICEATARRDLGLRVNISAREFARPELPQLVRSAIADSGLMPGRLCLEMTEMTLMDAPEAAVSTLAALRQVGVKFAIDDFGTGYSSLAYLKRLPVDVLKIDRTFISDIVTDSGSVAIVESIVGLGQALSLELVAEGVETEQQLAAVRRLGVERAQGFLVAPAMSPSDFTALVSEGGAGPSLR